MPIRITAAIVVLAAFSCVAPPAIAAEPAPAAVVAQLQAMNDADCRYSKNADWAGFEKTLAPEYVGINVDGSRDDVASIGAYFTKPTLDRVVACSTKVSAVTHDGDRYYLFGTYTEDGFRGAKRTAYHSVSRIRDTWENVDGGWFQTESLTYETTISVAGKVVGHYILPVALQTPPVAP